MAVSVFCLGLAHDRREQAAFDGDRHAHIRMLHLQDAILGPDRVRGRHALERDGQRLDDEVVDRELVGGLAVLVLAGGRVDLLAQGHERIELAIERQVEMRHRLLRLDEALGDGLAHAVEGHFLVGARLEHRLDLIGAHALSKLRRSGLGGGAAAAAAAGAAAGFAPPPETAERTSFSTMRPCGPEPWIDAMIDAGFLRDALGERRGEDAVAGSLPCPPFGFAAGRPGSLQRLHVAEPLRLACGCGCCGRCSRRGAASAFGAGAAAPPEAGAVTLFGSSPSPAISAMSWLTGTSAVPSGTTILARMPSSTASTSMVALSVSISAMTSPDFTVSPSFFSHLARLPFSMVGDRAGIRILMGMALMDPDRLRFS